MPRLLAVCAVHALRPDASSVGVTAIDKRPASGAVRIGAYGAYGTYADVQADRKHHGGLEKALYAYAQEDAEYWERELEVTMPRTPCQTFARWLGGDDERGWVTRFSNERRLGPYLRVVTTGRVQAGDEIVVVHRPADAPTIIDVYRAPV